LIIIDASVWVSYFLPDDVNHAASISWLAPEIANNTPLIGPTFLLSEVGGPVAR
jgi:predicted nucleic acid-binding protein